MLTHYSQPWYASVNEFPNTSTDYRVWHGILRVRCLHYIALSPCMDVCPFPLPPPSLSSLASPFSSPPRFHAPLLLPSAPSRLWPAPAVLSQKPCQQPSVCGHKCHDPEWQPAEPDSTSQLKQSPGNSRAQCPRETTQ